MSEQERHYRLRAVDSWFFRGARPFFLGESVGSELNGLFPPWPDTIVGALRASWARELGWRRGPWPPRICEALGDGFGDDGLGPLSFDGPHLVSWGDDAQRGASVTRWYPMPLHLVGTREPARGGDEALVWTPAGMLTPSAAPVVCDLGEVRLPELRTPSGAVLAGGKTGEGCWLNARGMGQVLAGRLPEQEDIRRQDQLWETEYRIGIARDATTRTAREGYMYSARHVRMLRGVGLGVTVTGGPAESARVLTLGGESRTAECDEVEVSGHPSVDVEALGRAPVLAAVLVTPGRLSPSALGAGARLPGLDGARVVCACVGKAQRVGGWSSTEQESRSVESHVPAGSVIFVEPDGVSAQTLLNATHVGERTRWGYGRVLWGAAALNG